MKTTILKFAAIGLLLTSFLFSGCGHSTTEESNSAKESENNKGNHANTPSNEPGTEYPGSAESVSNTITDTIKQNP